MQLLTIILIGIAANLDNLGISLSYGLRYHRIPIVYNVVISFISMLFAYFSILAGSWISGYIPMNVANILGGLVLIGLGCWFILKPVSQSTGNPQRITTIHWKESIVLGFILAINCLTIGFGAGFTGVPPFLASLSIGVFSFISIGIGVKLGHRIGYTWFGQQSDRIAGVLLVLIGLYEIFI
ncbi:manganese efflux pump MntP family protein [Sporosarcina cyprini]|uniref:manganese efflux pump MntP n=1 Tax=Sporosarcina cyprini TaxID=2910523 RepID=UPI001EDD1069|nr:manganese efflux pump [Sporosarcina cyprini]MCG3087756.1 manganese efflux pump [Sporosarcina cyprini]